MPGCKTVILGCVCIVAIAGPGVAQKKKPGAVADPATAGPDFLAQGEFSGLLPGKSRRRRVGWRVLALGEGKFRAMEFAGGLPLDGWDGKPPLPIDGQRKGNLVNFSIKGERYATGIGGEVWFRDPLDGELIGLLTKTRRESSTLGARPPTEAVVLFDGTSTEHFSGGRMTDDGLLMEGAITKRPVQNFSLHLEFCTPFMPAARGQQRANSGVYIQRRYEVQILDSFCLAGAANECGGLYRQRKPAMNLCLPPLSWQTYDIEFRAARFAAGKKIGNARISVRHNGVTIHDDLEITPTGAGQRVGESPQPLPILLQNHGNPVRFRNIWMIER